MRRPARPRPLTRAPRRLVLLLELARRREREDFREIHRARGRTRRAVLEVK